MQGSMRRWDGAFWLKIIGVLAVISLGDWLFYQRTEYMGAFGLIGLAIAAVLILTRPALRRDRRALLALGFAVIAATGMMWDAHPLPFVLFWVSIGLATLLPGTAAFDDGWRWFQRLFVQGIKSLFGPLIDFAKLTRIKRRRPPRGMGLRYWIKTLILPLGGSAIIVALFAQANPLVERFFTAFDITAPDEKLIARLILWGFLALITWGVLRPRPPRHLIGTFDGRGDAVIPGVSLASVTISLVLFNALFAAQNLMDSAFLWGGVKLPGDMTLADYAHRGAYPLLITALLAALFVLVALRPGSTTAENPLVRKLVMVWIGQNLFLVGSAALRTWDYVESYDLTQLRIAALLWMWLVAIGLVLVLVRMLKGKNAAWLINANLVSSGLVLFALCFVDLGTVAARWNIHHAREIDGTGAGLDLCYLNQLGGSALVPLAELELSQKGSPLGKMAAGLRWNTQQRLMSDRADGGWTLLNTRRIGQVNSLLGPAASQPQPYLEPCERYVD
ncbi:MAG: DUF4173 domain-containing protein [Sphingomonadales bacterium]|nr:DUF4173 domain-containing protein [Sphingomonadales bacterium]